MNRFERALIGVVATNLVVVTAPMTGQLTIRVNAAAGGGFTGFQVAEALQTPSFNCDEAGACSPVADSVDLVRNSFYRWTPALSSGVVVSVGA